MLYSMLLPLDKVPVICYSLTRLSNTETEWHLHPKPVSYRSETRKLAQAYYQYGRGGCRADFNWVLSLFLSNQSLAYVICPFHECVDLILKKQTYLAVRSGWVWFLILLFV